jgi:hypothetical protein
MVAFLYASIPKLSDGRPPIYVSNFMNDRSLLKKAKFKTCENIKRFYNGRNP